MKRKILVIMLTLILLISAVCACSSEQTGSSENGEINYVTHDNTPVYSEADDTSSCIAYVDEGDNVLVMAYSGVFCKVTTSSNKVGYINGRYLSPDDPITEATTEVNGEPEPSITSSVEETNATAPTETTTPTLEPAEPSEPTATPTPAAATRATPPVPATRATSASGLHSCSCPARQSWSWSPSSESRSSET